MYPNVTIIPNNTNCKYELGAYKVGINYVINNNLSFDYYIFTQDTLIIKNRYDFNILKNNNVTACTIYAYWYDNIWRGNIEAHQECSNILNNIGLCDNFENITFCWCNSFILQGSVIKEFLSLTHNIEITHKGHSMYSERFLARILYELNEHKNFDIDGLITLLKYNSWTVNLFDPIESHYFVKRNQFKPFN